MEGVRFNQPSSTNHDGGRARPIMSRNWINSDIRSDRFKSDRRTGCISNDDGRSVGLDREVQLRWPIIPWPSWSVRHSGCGGSCEVLPLRLLRRVFRDPECYVSVLATIVFTPVAVPIIDASITGIIVYPTQMSTRRVRSVSRERTHVLW